MASQYLGIGAPPNPALHGTRCLVKQFLQMIVISVAFACRLEAAVTMPEMQTSLEICVD